MGGDLSRPGSGRPRLLLNEEAADELRVGGEVARQDLQRHVAVEAHLAGAVDGSHPAFSDQLLDLVSAVDHVADLPVDDTAV